jgi:hypothetical protein
MNVSGAAVWFSVLVLMMIGPDTQGHCTSDWLPAERRSSPVIIPDTLSADTHYK